MVPLLLPGARNTVSLSLSLSLRVCVHVVSCISLIITYRREAAARFSVGEDADGVVRGNYVVTDTRPPILWRPAQTHWKIDALLRDTEQARRRIDAWNQEAQRTLEHADAAVASARTVEKEKRDELDAIIKGDLHKHSVHV